MSPYPDKLLALAVASLSLAFASPSPAHAEARPASSYTTFATKGAWGSFTNPQPIYRKGKVYAGWSRDFRTLQVGEMDTSSGAVRITTIADDFALSEGDVPSLLALPDGRLAVFYALRANGDLLCRVTTKADDIGEWTPERSLGFQGPGKFGPLSATAVLLSEEKNAIHLFWRGADQQPFVSVSKDLGETWSAPRVLLQRPKGERLNGPFLKVSSDGRKRIDIAFTDGHSSPEETNSLHFLRYEDGVFTKADGTRVGALEALPLDPVKCERLDEPDGAGRDHVWDIASLSGQVAIVYAHDESQYARHPTHHYLRWDGKQWINSPIFAKDQALPKGAMSYHDVTLSLDHRYIDTVYLSHPVNEIWEIGKWRTPDKGKSWRYKPVTRGSESENVNPAVVRNAPRGEPFLMWTNTGEQRLAPGTFLYGETRSYIQINRLESDQLPSLSPALEPAAVLAAMRRVGDWDLAHDWRIRPDDWVVAVGYTGLLALADTSSDSKYRDALRAIGETNEWKLGPTKYFADDHCIGQTYAELFLHERDPRMIAPMRAHFDAILAAPKDDNLDVTRKGAFDKWSWCDALFMAPPAWLRLSIATGDQRYLDFAVEHWWKTSDYLYDREEHLYFRDSGYFTKREANGQKVFWSRGNGWVMGGLVRMLQFLPKDDPSRPRFEEQFRQMSAKLLSLQQSDGMWRSSLLDPASYPSKETSGTGLISYGLAWGVNNGLLDRARYAPAVTKAWQALVSCVAPDGRLTHVQPVGADPQRFDPRSTDAFGVGAFLLAGSEVYRLVTPPAAPALSIPRPDHAKRHRK
jgi:rhamnogalacturonyl hydrolase YesR